MLQSRDSVNHTPKVRLDRHTKEGGPRWGRIKKGFRG